MARISIDSDEDLEQAEETLHDLRIADGNTPGWLNDELGLTAIIDDLEAGMESYRTKRGDYE